MSLSLKTVIEHSTSWSITVGIALVVTIHVFLLLFAFSFPLAPFLLFTWSSLRWARPIKTFQLQVEKKTFLPLIWLWTGVDNICEWVKSKLRKPHLQQLVQLLLQLLRVPVDLRLSRVEEETVAEHLPQIGQERSDAVVLVVVLVVQPLLDHVQGDRVFDLLQVLREVEISAVPEVQL